jgi:hypothetical protein
MHLILQQDGKTVTKTYQLIQIAFGDAAVSLE